MSGKTVGKSKNPAYPDAHPTAPGGMSRAALVRELIEKHNYEEATKAEWDQVKWPDLIDLVVEERLEREREEKALAQAETEVAEFAEFIETMAPLIEDIATEVDAHDEEVTAEWEREGYGEDTEGDIFAEFGLDDEPHVIDLAVEYEALSDEDKAKAKAAATFFEETQDPTEYEAAQTDEHEPEVIDPEVMFAQMQQARKAEQANQPAPLFLGIPGIKDYVFDGHAGAGPSAAERWMNCTMSLTMSRKFLETLTPNQQQVFAHGGGGKSAAREGTTAHSAAEVEANFILGRVTEEEVEHTLTELTFFPEEEGEAYDEEMAEYITEYVDLVKSYAQERGDDNVLIEARVEAAIPLADMHEGEVYIIRGSADCAVLPSKAKADRELVVADLKYGNGIHVDVDENPQVRIYALGVLDLLVDDEGNLITDVETVTYHIVQPRLGGIKTWSEPLEDLLQWRDEVLSPALTKALYGEAEGATFAPSDDTCQWCPARGTCPALTEQRLSQAGDLFDTIVDAEFADGPGAFPETSGLTDTRLGELLTQITGLIDLHKDLREEAQRRLHRGGSVPGFKLVSYTPPRKWGEAAAETLAEVEGVWKDPTLITPTQALKVLGDNEEALALVEPLIVTPDKRPIIAAEGDRRKEWTGTPPEQMFADESGTDG